MWTTSFAGSWSRLVALSLMRMAYTVLGSSYGGVKQRWLVVYTQAAHGLAEQTINKQHLKQSQAEYKAFSALTKRAFACVADAEVALAHL